MSLLPMSVSGSVLILFGVLFRIFGKKAVPSGTFYLIWKLAVLRLLLPVTLPIYYPVPENSGALRFPTEPPVLTEIPPVLFNPEQAVSPEASNFLPGLLLGIWAAGALGIGAFLFIRHFRWRKIYQMALPVDMTPPLGEISFGRPPRICQSDRIPGPLTYGVFRPVILLPADLNQGDLPCVLAHEMVHVRRRDNLFQWLFLLAFCLHWMNPLVWVLGYCFSRDMERSCDEEAVAELGMGRRKSYVQVLLRAEERRAGPLALSFGKHPTIERMENVMKMKAKKRVLIATGLIAAAGILTTVVSVDLQAMNPVTAEESVSSTADETENSAVALWKETEASDQSLADAKALAEFAIELYGVSAEGPVSENEDVKAAVRKGILDDEVIAALSAQAEEDENSTHLMLTIAAADVMPGLYQLGTISTESPANEMAGILFQVFADSVTE